MNTLDAITATLALKEQITSSLRAMSLEGYNLVPHYHYDNPVFSSSPCYENYDKDHICFELKNGELIIRNNNSFSGDIEETKKRLQEALALELSKPQGQAL